MESVLYYEPMPLMNTAAVTDVCQRFGLAVIPVTRAQAGECVGYLAGYQGFAPRPGAGQETPPEDRVLLFCEVERGKLDAVLEGLKAAGAPRALKAILTGTNASWSFARLARELSSEHRAMGGS